MEVLHICILLLNLRFDFRNSRATSLTLNGCMVQRVQMLSSVNLRNQTPLMIAVQTGKEEIVLAMVDFIGDEVCIVVPRYILYICTPFFRPESINMKSPTKKRVSSIVAILLI